MEYIPPELMKLIELLVIDGYICPEQRSIINDKADELGVDRALVDIVIDSLEQNRTKRARPLDVGSKKICERINEQQREPATKLLLGVCAHFANYYNFPVSIIRAVYLALCVISIIWFQYSWQLLLLIIPFIYPVFAGFINKQSGK